VEEGVTGRLVTAGSVAELAAAVTGLLATPEEAAAMGAVGRGRMQHRFAPTTAAAAYSSIYERVAVQ
jgi:glycosyltransferase involved in cell wall biosynthesis